MNRLLIIGAITLGFELVMAYPITPQQDVLNQLTTARMEIEVVKNLLDRRYQKSLRKNLEDASKRIAYSIDFLKADMNITKPVKLWHCTYISNLDGAHRGTGITRDVALAKSMEACRGPSGGNAYYCKDESNATCDQEE